MQNGTPYLKHSSGTGASMQYGFISIKGEFLYTIENLEEYYQTFGYSIEVAKAGVLPDEFLWDEYIKDFPGTYKHCLQIHIIRYLLQYSDTFRQKYGTQSNCWLAAHAAIVSKKGALCITCKMKHFCISGDDTGSIQNSEGVKAPEDFPERAGQDFSCCGGQSE